MINERIIKKLSELQLKKESKLSIYDKCQKHQKNVYKICITCKADICSQCEKDHHNHYLIKQEEIMPDSEEIKKLQFAIENYISDATELISEIKKWQKSINDQILLLEKNIKNNIILNSVDFINNYSKLKISLNTIIKFRKIYSMIIEPEKKSKNNKILSFLNEDNFISKQSNIYDYNSYNNMNYNYNDYLAMKYLIKDINNLKDNYIKKSKKIIDYVYKTNLNNLNNKISDNKEYYYKQKNNNNFNKSKNQNPVINLDLISNLMKAKIVQKNINKTTIDNQYNKSYDNISVFNRFNNYNTNNNNMNSSSNGNISIYSKKNYMKKFDSINSNKDFKDYNISTLSSNTYNDNRIIEKRNLII